MNKTITVLAAAPLAALLLARPVAAGASPFDPGSRLAQMAAALSLTDAQKAALRDAVASEKEAVVAVANAQETARVALGEAIRALPYDASVVSAAFPPVAAADADLAALRARLYAKCLAVLTPRQAMKANVFLAVATERMGEALHGAIARAAQDPSALPRFARLELSPDQKEQINAVVAAHAAHIETLLAQEKSARTALLARIRRPQMDEEGARAASAKVSAVDLELAQERGEIHSEISGVLTETQLARLTKAHGAVRDFLVSRVDAVVRLIDALL